MPKYLLKEVTVKPNGRKSRLKVTNENKSKTDDFTFGLPEIKPLANDKTTVVRTNNSNMYRKRYDTNKKPSLQKRIVNKGEEAYNFIKHIGNNFLENIGSGVK